jgi:hypothetical protein
LPDHWVNLGQAAHVVQAALDQRLEVAAGVSGAEFELFEAAFSSHLSDGDIRAVRRIRRKLLAGNGAWAHDRCEPGSLCRVEARPVQARPVVVSD